MRFDCGSIIAVFHSRCPFDRFCRCGRRENPYIHLVSNRSVGIDKRICHVAAGRFFRKNDIIILTFGILVQIPVRQFCHGVSVIAGIGNIGRRSVLLQIIVVWIQVIVNCSIRFQHTRAIIFHKANVSPIAVIEHACVQIQPARSFSNCIKDIFYSGIRVRIVSVDAHAILDDFFRRYLDSVVVSVDLVLIGIGKEIIVISFSRNQSAV